MTQVSVERTIDAPIEAVFRAVVEVERLPEMVPGVVRVEFLGEQRSGVGTRFRETRVMNGREMPTELEITELVENQHARMVADSHGTVWDTVFSVRPAPDGTELMIVMNARPHAILPRLLNPLMKGLFRRGMDKQIEAMKTHLERPDAADSGGAE